MNFSRSVIPLLALFFTISLFSCQKSIDSEIPNSPPQLSKELIENLNDETYGENDPVFAENQALDEYDPNDDNSKAQLAEKLPELSEHLALPADAQIKTPVPENQLQNQKVGEDGQCSGRATWNCALHLIVSKRKQRLYIESYGDPLAADISNKVSTGKGNKRTPDYHGHPAAWPVMKKTSTKYPHGDWNGFGNMPYALPLGIPGYFMHGTASIRNLGKPASHGCIRMHPLQARKIYTWIIKYIKGEGLSRKDIYITVQDDWTPRSSVSQANWSEPTPNELAQQYPTKTTSVGIPVLF